MEIINIEALKEANLGTFFDYLKTHLAENGDDDIYFQPVSKEQGALSQDLET